MDAARPAPVVPQVTHGRDLGGDLGGSTSSGLREPMEPTGGNQHLWCGAGPSVSPEVWGSVGDVAGAQGQQERGLAALGGAGPEGARAAPRQE